jgi:DNA-binding transcriptional ArsR family regulator
MSADSHPLRAKILDSLADPDAMLSATGFARAIGQPTARIAYHLRALEQTGKIEDAGTMQRSDGIERFYCRADR